MTQIAIGRAYLRRKIDLTGLVKKEEPRYWTFMINEILV